MRRLLDNVANGTVEKVNKLCTRGLDPNFHDPDSGETPLTLSTTLKSPNKMIIALVNGGALVDFRTKDGRTALHRAVEKSNLDALKVSIKVYISSCHSLVVFRPFRHFGATAKPFFVTQTLLDLGASPNYRDAKGLTPLYYTIIHQADVQLTEMLLHDHAATGAQDPQGWQEVHQVGPRDSNRESDREPRGAEELINSGVTKANLSGLQTRLGEASRSVTVLRCQHRCSERIGKYAASRMRC